ncbi:gamma-mobile-trio integrase GmtZ [Serratia marcescens]|uniref:gamma-mobile-trio integrase GmtZ n=1 Tax=Serratia marcescens TaxID=615 RepID=UPI00148C2D31|nr:integrase family protein [Serratia marcescens]
MTAKTSDALRHKAIKMVQNRISKTQVAKALGLGISTVGRITKHVGKTFTYYPEEVKHDVLQRITAGEKAATIGRELGIDKGVICLWQKKAKGIQRIREDIPNEVKTQAIKLVENGEMYTAVGRKLKVSAAAVRYWFKAAEARGETVMPPPQNKRTDKALLWVQRQYPHLAQWRDYAVEWLKGEHSALGTKTAALVAFFTRYLNEQGLPSAPEALLKRGAIVPDFFKVACPQSPGGVSYNNHMHSFINWVLLTYYSHRADDESPVISPAFFNPIIRLTSAGFPVNYESVQTPLPYGYIAELRKLLAQGPSFSDWIWAQNALGVKRAGEFSTRMAKDWFPVTEDEIDRNDPDCVWRIRRSVDPKVKPVLEMWSPVRWVALLIKLQLPPRTFQVRMLDSGEADTWRYSGGHWIDNTNPLVSGSKRNPVQQGVFRRSDRLGQGDMRTTLFFNTNKTADIRKSGTHKGYEFPWPVMGELCDQPHYWLEKMRNWQEKYNPIVRPTPWKEIPSRCIGEPKSDMQLASYPDTCFLFRTAERRKYGENTFPVTDGTISGAWGKLLEALQHRFAMSDTKHPDGTPIVLVTRPGNSPIAVFPLHSLRVSLITALAIEGELPFPLLMKLVGHSRLIMTLYYTKPGFRHMQDALEDAAKRIDAKKEKSIVSFLANETHAKLIERAIYNSQDAFKALIPESPANRNPVGWMLMHHGLCLVGGNTQESEPSINKGGFKLGGCYNGGPAVNPEAENRIYRPVPGGIRNCIRCRWFVTEPHYVPALAAHLGNVCYQFDEARDMALRQNAELQDLKRQKVDTENTGAVFSKELALRTTERLWESTMQRFSHLAEDMAACWQLINRCNALPVPNEDTTTVMVAAGSEMDVQAGFEEVDSELLQLSGVCLNIEIYPDLEPGKAIFRRSQLLDAALARDHLPPIFLRLTEEEQLKAGNAFLRDLAKKADPNPLLGIRHVCNLIDGGASLAKFIGTDAQEFINNTIGSYSNPLRLSYKNA